MKRLMNKLMINYMIINVQPYKREARPKLFPINVSLMFLFSCTLMLERPEIRHHRHRHHQ